MSRTSVEVTARTLGLKAEEYEVKSVAKNKSGGISATLVLICKDKEAAKRLLRAPAFTYEDDDDIAAIWVTDPYSTGEWVILDMTNAPLGRDEFLVGCYGLFKDHIAWSNAEKNKGKSVPVDFRIAKVTRAMARPANLPKRGRRTAKATERTQQQDPTTEMWRAAFKITSQAARSWTIPRNGGPNGAKGEVRIDHPPFCDKCLSWSHQRRHCQWWDQPSVVPKVVEPWDYIPMEWEDVKSFATAKLSWEKLQAGNGKGKDKDVQPTQQTGNGGEAGQEAQPTPRNQPTASGSRAR